MSEREVAIVKIIMASFALVSMVSVLVYLIIGLLEGAK
jgi:hypothetical protein